MTAEILVPVAFGELLDKISILQIKSERISDEAKLANVRTELSALEKTWMAHPAGGKDVAETLMKGTQFGPVVLPGDPLTSVLVMLIEGRVDPSLRMPHGDATTPTADEILTIRRWVEQGAKNN